jgi:DHA1 family bicyclomycin/chloramphenicol resistance-like MFS transporter
VLDQIAGFRASFVLLTVSGAIVLVAAWFTLHETNHNRRRGEPLWQPSHFARLLGTQRFRSYALTLACASAVFFIFLAVAPFLMVNVMGRSPVEYGFWFIAVSLGYMAGNFLSGRYSERVGNDQMVRFGNWLTLFGATLTLAAALLGYLTPATLFLPMLFCALGNGLTIPNGTIGAISVDRALIGTAAGLAGCLQMSFGAIVSQGVGSGQDTYPLLGLWAMAACALAGLLFHGRTMRSTAGISM